MNLDGAPSGLPVTLNRPELGPRRARRLAELGLRAGATVTPLHRTAGGGRVIGVGTARVAVAGPVLERMTLAGAESTELAAPAVVPASRRALHDDGEDAPVLAPTGAPGLKGCHTGAAGPAQDAAAVIAVAGSPNVGKSTLFNALTGARVQMGNWPGTTVEVGQGAWRLPRGAVTLIDLPGAYSLDPVSPDEALTRALLVDAPCYDRPDLVIVTVSAADAARGLYLVSQLRELPQRLLVVLTMNDVARRRGTALDTQALSQALGVPVVAVNPRHRHDLEALAPAVEAALDGPVPPEVEFEVRGGDPDDDLARADARFAWVAAAIDAAHRSEGHDRGSLAARVDRVVTSPVLGPLLFLAVMWVVFQITTAGAAPLVDGLDGLVNGPVRSALAGLLGSLGLGQTWVASLVLDGLLAGVGMVLTFVPLMAIMFALLALLEDSGYMARAAVVADRLMRVIGLPGKAFVPLIVGFGCNVPAVSATRVLPDARHRLLTALVVPFTTCSARLPVYVLVAAAIFGSEAGNVVFGMYVASVGLIILGGLLLRATLLRDVPTEPLVLDLPEYQVPLPRMLAVVTWTRLAAFLRTATGIIVVTVTGVWLLTAIPVHGEGTFADVPVEDSAFAAVASTIAPVFEPAGFGDWHTTGALMVGFIAKEAVISSWAQTYAADQPDELNQPGALGDAVLAEFEASSGGHPKVAGLAFLLFVLGYSACVATVTAQVREIGRRWTLLGVVMTLSLSWVVAVTVFQVGRLIA